MLATARKSLAQLGSKVPSPSPMEFCIDCAGGLVQHTLLQLARAMLAPISIPLHTDDIGGSDRGTDAIASVASRPQGCVIDCTISAGAGRGKRSWHATPRSWQDFTAALGYAPLSEVGEVSV